MKALIIEDEVPAARRLEKLLNECDSSISIVDIIDTVEDAIEWLTENTHPDVIFSDIQLADGVSFSIYEAVNPTCPIIFTTAYDQYAIKAFELNSVDYLLKPFTKEQLEKSLNKLASTSTSSSGASNPVNVQEIIKEVSKSFGGGYKQRFLISKGDALIPISASSIAYLYTEDKAVMIKTKDGKSYFINFSLDELEEQLDPNIFFRLNRQFITHLDAIDRISQYFNGKLKIELNPPYEGEIIVSRAKTPVFKSWLEQ